MIRATNPSGANLNAAGGGPRRGAQERAESIERSQRTCCLKYDEYNLISKLYLIDFIPNRFQDPAMSGATCNSGRKVAAAANLSCG
ncbi:hypothetical protein FJU30_17505 [Affinibrenneria salicis]|uniref:Uncharacterized protein n=1 Tax=Affinibrenneria salicis TaxID=2590031 RepID=A0A5J5FWL5_9GAMM|nr:hypothetical protein FJU30_17505 [Affinibrenneria salicis]